MKNVLSRWWSSQLFVGKPNRSTFLPIVLQAFNNIRNEALLGFGFIFKILHAHFYFLTVSIMLSSHYKVLTVVCWLAKPAVMVNNSL